MSLTNIVEKKKQYGNSIKNFLCINMISVPYSAIQILIGIKIKILRHLEKLTSKT